MRSFSDPSEHTGHAKGSMTTGSPSSQRSARRHAWGNRRVPATSFGGACKNAVEWGMESPLRRLRSRGDEDTFKFSKPLVQ